MFEIFNYEGFTLEFTVASRGIVILSGNHPEKGGYSNLS